MMTVLYFTSNSENEKYESLVRDGIKKACGNLPILSVSQKPIDFGHNVCIGDVGMSPENLAKQLLIGATLVDTKWIALCESDGAYPPSYFTVVPEDESTIYYPEQVWITWNRRYKKMFWPKVRRDVSGIISRKQLMRLSGMFVDDITRYNNDWLVRDLSRQVEFKTEYPVVTMVTQESMHQTQSVFGAGKRELPGWGTYSEFWNRFGRNK